jgi:hypothetical protein
MNCLILGPASSSTATASAAAFWVRDSCASFVLHLSIPKDIVQVEQLEQLEQLDVEEDSKPDHFFR